MQHRQRAVILNALTFRRILYPGKWIEWNKVDVIENLLHIEDSKYTQKKGVVRENTSFISLLKLLCILLGLWRGLEIYKRPLILSEKLRVHITI